MAKPFGVGDVVGGRYRITHHVVTSADQDIIFQATDEVLERQVSVLLASRANAKQVATSAKELATGERASEVQVLDLGLTAERTYLISSLVDPNQLLDLVVPDTAPYVEPYFTDSLGSELFGQSRQMQPQTYDDDAEYYSRLQKDLSADPSSSGRILPPVPGLPKRRPAFLDRVTPSHSGDDQHSGGDSHRDAHADSAASAAPDSATGAPPKAAGGLQQRVQEAGLAHGIDVGNDSAGGFSLRSDREEVSVDPSADGEETIESVVAEPRSALSLNTGDSGPFQEQDPSRAMQALHTTGVPPRGSLHSSPEHAASPTAAEGEEVVDDPPEVPDLFYDYRPSDDIVEAEDPSASPPPPPASEGGSGSAWVEQDPASFTSLISAVPSRPAASSSTQNAAATAGMEKRPGFFPSGEKPGLTWWIAAGVLAVLVVLASILLFTQLGGS